MSAPGYTCNSYTFCYDATVLAAGLACNYTDSILDIITLFDNANEVSCQSNVSSWFNRMSGGDGTVLPIELTQFAAQWQDRAVVINWNTAAELNTSHFELERTGENGTEWELIATKQAAGNSTHTLNYRYTDRTAPAGSNYYRLRAVDQDQTFSMHGPVHVRVPFSMTGTLQISPNPAAEKAWVKMTTDQEAQRAWSLKSTDGRPVLTGMETLTSGAQVFELNLSGIPSGVYYFHMEGYPSAILIRQ